MLKLLELIMAWLGKKQPETEPKALMPWYDVMVEITGTHEYAGSSDNPNILTWPKYIAGEFPEMAAYCKGYNHDSIPWCGLTVAYCMTRAGIRPQFGNTDVERFLWADAWKEFGEPCEPKLGCVMVFTRNGGGHVTLYEGEEGDYFICRGGNQSDQVNVSRYRKSQFTCARWPELV